MQSDIVLLLTGTINTNNKFFTAVNDQQQRRNEYVASIKYYLSAFDHPIVFVENSGVDISADLAAEIGAGKLEVLSFNGNDYAPELGKGLGEMRCIQHGIEHSAAIKPESFVMKITGRYKIKNLHRYIRFYQEHEDTDILADLTGNMTLSASAFFGFRPFFGTRYLFKNSGMLNDSDLWFFEHVLARSVLQAIGDRVNFRILKYYPKLSAISGTTGKRYNESFFYYLPRYLKYRIRYYIIMR